MDDNEKAYKQAMDMERFKERAQHYQRQMLALQNKEYDGIYHGVKATMKGDFTLLSFSIDQSVYETAGKAQIENIFLTLMTNLHTAIVREQKALEKEMNEELTKMRLSSMSYESD